ncbi:MAG: Lrp/AsnC family transcriptional regulator, partial [Nanoarchaeales archaeon]|nr:Lrp/AsnC family transcriptional regulator [Nanoarchaeales archaeon]
KLSGGYDLLISFIIKDSNDLKNYFDSLNSNFSDFIEKKELITRLYEIKHEYEILFGKRKEYKQVKNTNLTSYSLDKIDKKILSYLGENANISTVDLANKLNLSSPAIIYRLKNLKEKDIILNYIAVINICKLEKQFYYIFFNIDLNKDKENIVKNILNENESIIFAEQNAGNQSYMCLIVANNNTDFNSILQGLKNQILSMNNLDSISLLNIIYQNYCPVNFFN